MFKDFKKFIARGNVVDLAVGVIIGGAFGKIVTSLVDDIFMPVIGAIIGGVDFSGLSITVGEATIKYGSFIQNVIDFLIVAFVIFLVVRFITRFEAKMEELKEKSKLDEAMSKLKNKAGIKDEPEEETPVPEVPEDIKLLREINASLKKLNKQSKN